MMTPTDSGLVTVIRSRLRDIGDQQRALKMQEYMKSDMPFLGIAMPDVKRTVRELTRTSPPADLAEIRQVAQTLWREADYREERYAAFELTDLKLARKRIELIDLYTEMIVTGAWWDHCDAVSARLADLMVAHPETLNPLMHEWTTAESIWLRRASIICQLGLRAKADVALLTAAIDANAQHKETFISKAIGWALRDYARTNPEWVRTFVAERDNVLSALSKREAFKHLLP